MILLNKTLVSQLFKPLISLLLLFVIISWVDIRGLIGILKSVNPFLIIYCICINLTLMWISAVKTGLIFGRSGLPVFALLKCNFIKTFSTYIVPGDISGEIIRSYFIGKVAGSYTSAVGAVLVDRITGFWIQSAMAVAAVFFLAGQSSRGGVMTLWGIGFFFLCVILSAALFPLAMKVIPILVKAAGRFLKKELQVGDTNLLNRLLQDKLRFLKVMVLGIIYQSSIIYIILVYDNATGNTLTIFHAALLNFLSVIAIALPISFNGIGVMEGVLGFTFNYLGGSAEIGVAVSLLIRLTALPSAVMGWVIFVRSDLKIPWLNRPHRPDNEGTPPSLML